MSQYNTILSNIKAAVPELSDPTNANISQTDPLIKIASALAPTIDNTITEIENTITEIENIIGNIKYGKPGYYVQKAKEYQDLALGGSSLTIDPITFEPVYESVVESAKIIKQASYVKTLTGGDQFYIQTLKVAKDNGTGGLTNLSNTELTNFRNYFLNFDPPGMHINVYSDTPNVINLLAKVTYKYGYVLSDIQSKINDAIVEFRDNFEFNGRLFLNDISSYITSNVTGVRNVAFLAATIDGTSFIDDGDTDLTAGLFDWDGSVAGMFENTANYEWI